MSSREAAEHHTAAPAWLATTRPDSHSVGKDRPVTLPGSWQQPGYGHCSSSPVGQQNAASAQRQPAPGKRMPRRAHHAGCATMGTAASADFERKKERKSTPWAWVEEARQGWTSTHTKSQPCRQELLGSSATTLSATGSNGTTQPIPSLLRRYLARSGRID